jgi:NADH-quinone oxidoreductase subunit M
MSRSKLAILVAAVTLGGATSAWAQGSRLLPKLELSPQRAEFAEAGGAQTITVKNAGDAPLNIYRFALREEGMEKAKRPRFTTQAPGSRTLAPGESMTVEITYTPHTPRNNPQAFGALQVLSNDRGAGRATTDPVTGQRVFVSAAELRAGNTLIRTTLLPIMVFFPLVGVLLMAFLKRERLVKGVAFAATLVPLAAGAYLYATFDRALGLADGTWGLQYVSHTVWIERFNIEFFMGTDGISVLMLLLTALVSVIACISSFSIKKHVRGYFAMFLLLETGMMGTFASLDFFLFYVFWEVMLLPMYFLIGIWGGPRKEYAAIKFFLYTLAGSVLMLLGLIALYYSSGTKGVGIAPLTLVDGSMAEHTFNLMKLSYLNNFAAAPALLGVKFSYLIWIGLFIGFAIKVPMFPFHTWLPDAHVEAPTAISVILAGVLLKMGTYGMFRMNYGILPEATHWAATAVAVFGVINILYGAFCAMAQTDLKKLVAYSSVSHMGYCLLGMAALTTTGMAGSMMQMFNHGTITSMLFLLVGVLYDRAHTRGVNEFGGVASVMPRYAAVFGFAFMASLGLPGLSGFIGEALVFLGAFNAYRVLTILAVTGVIVTAAYHLWAMQRIQLGPFKEKWREALKLDLDRREMVMLVPLAVLVLVLGFYPMPALDLMNQGLVDLQKHVADAAPAIVPAALGGH